MHRMGGKKTFPLLLKQAADTRLMGSYAVTAPVLKDTPFKCLILPLC